MSCQVWLRFEKKRNGEVRKFRIQDLPPGRIDEATGLMMKYFARDEPLRKAIGFINNPDALEEYREYAEKTFHDPASRNVMCCADADDGKPEIMGLSSIGVASAAYFDLCAGNTTKESKKMNELFYEAVQVFDVLKEYNLTTYYADKSILVVPEYRGYGIAEKFLTVRFEKKRNGEVRKFRIQDLPPGRIDEATGLMMKYFARDEPLRKAIGFINNPDALEEYREYAEKTFHDPASRNVMCCADADDGKPEIMGLSSIGVASAAYFDLCAGNTTKESKKMNELFYEAVQVFDVLKEYNLTTYYADKSILVVPEYRGYGIAEKFLTVRRLMCAAHAIPLTAAWMTNHATQIAAQRDTWICVFDRDYGEISKNHGLNFEDVPPTIKLFVAGPYPEYSSNKLGQIS